MALNVIDGNGSGGCGVFERHGSRQKGIRLEGGI